MFQVRGRPINLCFLYCGLWGLVSSSYNTTSQLSRLGVKYQPTTPACKRDLYLFSLVKKGQINRKAESKTASSQGQTVCAAVEPGVSDPGWRHRKHPRQAAGLPSRTRWQGGSQSEGLWEGRRPREGEEQHQTWEDSLRDSYSKQSDNHTGEAAASSNHLKEFGCF